MTPSVTWVSDGFGSARVMVGLDLKGLFPPSLFYDSILFQFIL